MNKDNYNNSMAMIAINNILPQFSESIPSIVDNLNILRGGMLSDNLDEILEMLDATGERISADNASIKFIVDYIVSNIISSNLLYDVNTSIGELMRDVVNDSIIDYSSYYLISIDADEIVIGMT